MQHDKLFAKLSLFYYHGAHQRRISRVYKFFVCLFAFCQGCCCCRFFFFSVPDKRLCELKDLIQSFDSDILFSLLIKTAWISLLHIFSAHLVTLSSNRCETSKRENNHYFWGTANRQLQKPCNLQFYTFALTVWELHMHWVCFAGKLLWTKQFPIVLKELGVT